MRSMSEYVQEIRRGRPLEILPARVLRQQRQPIEVHHRALSGARLDLQSCGASIPTRFACTKGER